MAIDNLEKAYLGELLAQGHRKFGRVAPRRKYKDNDKNGGAGTAEFLYETHPYFAEVPEGAPSDLTCITNDYRDKEDENAKRDAELSAELKKNLEKQHKEQPAYHYTEKPRPY